MKYVQRYAHFAIALIVLLFFFIGAGDISKNAKRMELLRSQGGTSVAEAYYQAQGGALSGEATVYKGIGLGFTVFIVYLGEMLVMKKQKNEKQAEINTIL